MDTITIDTTHTPVPAPPPAQDPTGPLAIEIRPNLRRLHVIAGDVLAAIGKRRDIAGKGHNEQEDIDHAQAWLHAHQTPDLTIHHTQRLRPNTLRRLRELAHEGGVERLWLLHAPPRSDSIAHALDRQATRTGTTGEIPQTASPNTTHDNHDNHDTTTDPSAHGARSITGTHSSHSAHRDAVKTRPTRPTGSLGPSHRSSSPTSGPPARTSSTPPNFRKSVNDSRLRSATPARRSPVPAPPRPPSPTSSSRSSTTHPATPSSPSTSAACRSPPGTTTSTSRSTTPGSTTTKNDPSTPRTTSTPPCSPTASPTGP